MDKDKYIGRLLDNRYEILEMIGSGGMAVVYKARCHRLNRLVAVKILKDDNSDDEDFRRRFHAESQAVAMLSHPNIVAVYDVSTSLKADYIVMELIEGITLKQYMEKRGMLSWKETLHFAMQIAKALEHAHSKGIVHRDIKPHNVMVLKNGSVKVMDFGIARLISRGNTLTKEALGSVHYISPEQARGGRVDNRSDIYSLGVVMYEMMTGRPPYDGDSPVSVAIQHINGGAVLPSMLNPNIPRGLEQIIMKSMAHSVDDRYATATHMLADMEEFRKDATLVFPYTEALLRPVDQPQAGPETAEKQKNFKKSAMGNQKGMDARRRQEEQRRQEAQRRQKQRRYQEQKRSKVAVIAIIICSLVAAIAIGIFMMILLGGGFTPEQKLIEIPKLTGQKFSELQKYPGLDIVKEELYNDTVEAGRIISQQPEAGIEVVEDSLVVVYVSLGPVPNVVTMADVVGRSEEWSNIFLESLKLKLNIEIKREWNDSVPKGHVYRTEPKEGTVLTKGQSVTLWVSKGSMVQISSMPNLVNVEKSTALNLLDEKRLDLEILVEEVFDFNVKAGCVIQTEPAAGDKIQTGQVIKLYVSKGVEKKVMPDLLGKDLESALELLTTVGFGQPSITYEHNAAPQNTIISQSLEHSKEYEITTPIALVVSLGIEKKEMPNLVGKYSNEALDILSKMGFKNVTVVPIYSDEFVDTVLSQSLTAGVEYEITEPITLEVSMGIEKKVLPDLVNRNVNAVLELLEEMCFTNVHVVYDYSPAPYGVVLGQSLAKDTAHEITAYLLLTVSNGIEKKVLPDLVGMTVEDAEALLEELGFTANITVQYVENDAPKGTVLSQSLEKDLEYVPDIDIFLELSEGPAPMVVKDVVIDLQRSADAGSCYITITRDDIGVYSGIINKGTSTITLRDQKGLGDVFYTITVNGKDSWTVLEVFAFDE